MSSQFPAKPLGRPTEEACEARAAGRPRCPEAHRKILCAAHELLREQGFVSMSIEGIAERAGVGKTTIYRRWPSKAALVMDAFLELAAEQTPFVETGSLREDLRRHLRLVVRALNQPTGRMLATLIGGAQSDDELAAAFRDYYLTAKRAEAKTAIKRGIARGEMRADINADLLLDALYGPVYMRLLIRHGALTAAYADKLVELVMSGLDGPAGRRRSAPATQ